MSEKKLPWITSVHDGFFQKARDYDSSPLRKRCTVIELLQLDNFVYVGLSPREKNNMPTHAFREPLPLYFELDVFAHKKIMPTFPSIQIYERERFFEQNCR